MTVFLTPYNPLPFWMFKYDATVSESLSLDVEWTQEASEAGGNVSDYGWYGPTRFEMSGIITSTPFPSATNPLGRHSRQDILRTLERVTKERQEVWVTSPNWVRLAVIVSIQASHNQPGGAAFEVTITCQTIERAEYLTTELPVAPDVAPPAEVCVCPDTGSAAATAGAQDSIPVDTSPDIYGGQTPTFLRELSDSGSTQQATSSILNRAGLGGILPSSTGSAAGVAVAGLP